MGKDIKRENKQEDIRMVNHIYQANEKDSKLPTLPIVLGRNEKKRQIQEFIRQHGYKRGMELLKAAQKREATRNKFIQKRKVGNVMVPENPQT
jgi:hypothetical protein